jgi:hypothetical protein
MHHVEELKDIITVPVMKYAIAQNNKPDIKNFVSLIDSNVLPDIWSVEHNATVPIHLLPEGASVIVGFLLCHYTIKQVDGVKYGLNAKLQSLYVVDPVALTEPILDIFANPVAYLQKYGSSGNKHGL